jgi:hypothetical protein
VLAAKARELLAKRARSYARRARLTTLPQARGLPKQGSGGSVSIYIVEARAPAAARSRGEPPLSSESCPQGEDSIVERARLDRMLSSQEVATLISA